ncbi:MAG: hypothetical protein HKP25_14850 [Marinicaulis sp.]|nr:hypothetical protein [Marinicaulis sp.]
MINAQVDEENAILVTEICDEYSVEEYKRIMDIKIDLAERRGRFCEMELFHGEGRNAVTAGVGPTKRSRIR